MTDKPEPKDAKKDAKKPRPFIHLKMMGDGTKEQNLGERGDPSKRIKEHEVDAAFNQGAPKKKPDFEFDDEVNTEPTANAMTALPPHILG